MPRFVLAPLTFFLLGLLAGCGSINTPIEIPAGEQVEGSLRSVNGALRIGSEARVTGNLSNVNGPIEVGPGALVGSITNVNGLIELQAGAEAGPTESVNGAVALAPQTVIRGGISAVNGSIEIAEDSRVEGDVQTVNGRVSLKPNVAVQGKVANVRGRIELDGASAGAIETTVGSIDLTGSTVVTGLLWVRAAQDGDNHVPRIVIGPGVRVTGPLRFDREVELLVHDTAEVGEIIGAEPQCFSCEITDL
ncbi:MAG: hypothetical protein ACLFSC_08080 [Wenzhouxiangella sp.]